MEAQSELDSLTASADAAAANATTTLEEAQELNSEAQMLENDATGISLEDIHSELNYTGNHNNAYCLLQHC